jgi:hypothetical protein
MQKKTLILVTWVALALVLALAGAVWAGGGPPPKPACGTSGPIKVTAFSPSANYSYVQNSAGSTAASFTVSSPDLQINPSCN